MGPTGSFTPLGQFYSDYVFWNSATSAWDVGSSQVHLGKEAGTLNQNNNAVAIGAYAGNQTQ